MLYEMFLQPATFAKEDTRFAKTVGLIMPLQSNVHIVTQKPAKASARSLDAPLHSIHTTLLLLPPALHSPLAGRRPSKAPSPPSTPAHWKQRRDMGPSEAHGHRTTRHAW